MTRAPVSRRPAKAPPVPLPPQPGTPAHMLMMMRNCTRYAGDTEWARVMNEAREYFETMVSINQLQEYKGKWPLSI